MKLDDIVRNSVKAGGAVIAAGAVIYGMEASGIKDWMIGFEINRLAYFGEGSRNFAEAVAPVTVRISEALFGGIAGYFVYNLISGFKSSIRKDCY